MPRCRARAPVVVAGDFNDWRLRGHRQLARAARWSTCIAHPRGRPARTFPARTHCCGCDRIYVRDARLHDPIMLPQRPWSHLSDHTPLAAEVTL